MEYRGEEREGGLTAEPKRPSGQINGLFEEIFSQQSNIESQIEPILIEDIPSVKEDGIAESEVVRNLKVIIENNRRILERINL